MYKRNVPFILNDMIFYPIATVFLPIIRHQNYSILNKRFSCNIETLEPEIWSEDPYGSTFLTHGQSIYHQS